MFKNLVRLSLRATCRRHLNQYKYYHNFSIIKRLYSNNNGNIDNEKIKSNLINILRKIEHPSNKDKDIVYLGLIKKININNNKNNNDNYIISIDLELDRYFREIKKNIISLIEKECNDINIDSIRVNMAEKVSERVSNNKKENVLKNVKNIIAVSSCKGGVGKSSIAVNIAYTLSKMEYRVGIFDADIYGPSLPTLTSANINNCDLIQNIETQLIYPIIYEGVKLMSFGFVTKSNINNNNDANIMRGPMVSNIIQQLLFQTDWGDLDYLIIDFPPGTSDIHITLTQKLNINGAIIITTPQLLSLIDVIKGIEMFKKVNVPIIGLIKNMTYFICNKCQTKQEIFNNNMNNNHDINNELNKIKNIYELPIYPLISQFSDYGDPIVLNNDKIINPIFEDIANGIINEFQDVNSNNTTKYKWEIDQSDKKIKFININEEKDFVEIDFVDLRYICQCALCIEEISGKQIIKKEDIDSKNISINFIEECGNYGVRIIWFDKHQSIYSFQHIFDSVKH